MGVLQWCDGERRALGYGMLGRGLRVAGCGEPGRLEKRYG